ncbi:hypothetical protein GQ42DRAFT_159649 [Ramicandelaber brevisporus]|nr:hypothetical protein GQ42DRAFT_159649 [Ramicandelaber brevisporus]
MGSSSESGGGSKTADISFPQSEAYSDVSLDNPLSLLPYDPAKSDPHDPSLLLPALNISKTALTLNVDGFSLLGNITTELIQSQTDSLCEHIRPDFAYPSELDSKRIIFNEKVNRLRERDRQVDVEQYVLPNYPPINLTSFTMGDGYIHPQVAAHKLSTGSTAGLSKLSSKNMISWKGAGVITGLINEAEKSWIPVRNFLALVARIESLRLNVIDPFIFEKRDDLFIDMKDKLIKEVHLLARKFHAYSTGKKQPAHQVPSIGMSDNAPTNKQLQDEGINIIENMASNIKLKFDEFIKKNPIKLDSPSVIRPQNTSHPSLKHHKASSSAKGKKSNASSASTATHNKHKGDNTNKDGDDHGDTSDSKWYSFSEYWALKLWEVYLLLAH